jgi:hypothetical protein
MPLAAHPISLQDNDDPQTFRFPGQVRAVMAQVTWGRLWIWQQDLGGDENPLSITVERGEPVTLPFTGPDVVLRVSSDAPCSTGRLFALWT